MTENNTQKPAPETDGASAFYALQYLQDGSWSHAKIFDNESEAKREAQCLKSYAHYSRQTSRFRVVKISVTIEEVQP